MKKYLSPETMSLQVNAQTFLCGSETPPPSAPGRMNLPKATKVAETWI